MLTRIIAVLTRDLKSGLRDAMIAYIMIVPILIAIVLKLLVPSAGANLIHVAVLESADPAFISMLEDHGRVEILADRDALVNRVSAVDDVIGLIETPQGTEMIAGGNEQEGTVEMVTAVVDLWQNRDLEIPVLVRFSDVGWELSPLAQYGTSFLIVFVSVFGGMVVMLNLVEEKQANTLAAINVSAISRLEFVVGKGLLGFILPLFHAFAILLIMGFTSIHIGMTVVVVLSIALISLIFGFVIGIYNDNSMSAVSSMKIGFIPIFGSVFGAMFLDSQWHPFLYWSPFYWAFRSIDQIILQQAVWNDMLLNSLYILLITMMVFALLYKRIKRGFA